jgi:biopolymer transport protein ExbD
MKKLAILMITALFLMGLTGGISLAKAEETAKLEKLSGQVVEVNATAGKIVIMANGQNQQLTAEPNLLKGIKAGEQVDIEKAGQVLKSIKRAEVKPIE